MLKEQSIEKNLKQMENDQKLKLDSMYSETILMQDLILINDIISLPELLLMFSESQMSRRQLEI